jgi:hypothetical protein
MIRSLVLEDCTVWFVAHGEGLPLSHGYFSRTKAEEVEALLERTGGEATIPIGVDFKRLLRGLKAAE